MRGADFFPPFQVFNDMMHASTSVCETGAKFDYIKGGCVTINKFINED
jgi:hypothetical protein